jgi:hypothetical protein
LLGAGVLTDTIGDGVDGLVVGFFVGEGVLSGHGGHTDEFGEGEGGGVLVPGTPGQLGPLHGGEGGGVVTAGTSGQSVPSHGEGAYVGCLKPADGEGVPPGVNGVTGASVRTGSMEEQMVGDGDWVEVISVPSFLPVEGVGGQ